MGKSVVLLEHDPKLLTKQIEVRAATMDIRPINDDLSAVYRLKPVDALEKS
jgi:hypothetical protein